MVGVLLPVATTNTSVWVSSLSKVSKSFTRTLNLLAISCAFSLVRLIRVICSFWVCLIRFSQVLRPIFPVPKSNIFFWEISATFCMIYCTEAKDTEVAPLESSVSFLMRLLAWMTQLSKRSIKALTRLYFFAKEKDFFS